MANIEASLLIFMKTLATQHVPDIGNAGATSSETDGTAGDPEVDEVEATEDRRKSGGSGASSHPEAERGDRAAAERVAGESQASPADSSRTPGDETARCS